MTKFKKIIPALCMLLISAVLMGTSTYAWFSMNTTVSATGMKVTANAQETYLLIAEGEKTYQEVQAGKLITVPLTVSDADAKVYPVAHKTESFDNTTAASTAGNWYYKIADKSDASTSTGAETVLTTFTGFVIEKTVTLSLAKGSVAKTDISAEVTLESAATDGIDAARVLITSSNKAVDFKTETAKSVVYSGKITDTSVVVLHIYIYIDGNDTAVFTDNYAALNTANISIVFSVPNA